MFGKKLMPQKMLTLKMIVRGLMFWVVFLPALLLVGCGGVKTANLSNVPPPVAGQVPIKRDFVSATPSEKPVWINEIPEDANGMRFMVGLSDFFTSEKSAREAAMKDARAQYAHFTGVEVSEIDEVSRFLEGRESDTFNAQISGRSQQTQKTDARVSRIKAKSYYTESYNESKRGVYTGTSSKAWVLVTIPVDEDKRVDEWRAAKAQNMRASRAELQASAETELQKLVAGQQRTLNAIDEAMAQGQPLQALGLIAQQRKLLLAEQERYLGGSRELQAKSHQIAPLQHRLASKAQSIQGKLVLDSGRFGGLRLMPTRGEKAVPVWAWVRHGDGMLPVASMPLILKNLEGVVLSQAITDPSGRAQFYLPAELSGPVIASIDTAAGMTSFLSEDICNGLARVNGRLNLAATGSSLSRSVKYGVQELFSGGAHSELIARQVLLGAITYEATGLGGEFPQLLKRQLRQALKEVRGLSLVEPRRRSARVVENAVKTRGIKLNSSQPAPSIGSAAMQAVMDGAEAALEGTYTVYPDVIQVDLSLRKARTDEVLGAVSTQIPRDAVSAGVELVPSQTAALSSGGPAVGGAINVEITSSFGNGQTYTEGDVINYFASLDRDAYMLLIYEDAGGNLLQIFPNSRSGNPTFAAGSAIQVPQESDPFEFEISEPFGREQVFAFASTEPFPELSGAGHPSGLRVLNIGMDKVLKTLRTSGSRSGAAYGEAFTVLTTVAKQ
jgi:hypothetical protein